MHSQKKTFIQDQIAENAWNQDTKDDDDSSSSSCYCGKHFDYYCHQTSGQY